MTTRLVTAAAVLCAAILPQCTASRAPDELGSSGSALLPLTDPGDGGAGPYALFVCSTSNTNGNCGGVAVSDGASLTTALTPPAAATASFPLAFPFVHSWNLGREVNLWDYDFGATQNRGLFLSDGGTSGNTDVDIRAFIPGNTASPRNYGLVFTGFIAVPASGADFVKTFAIGSNDGAYFAVQGCGATCATTQIYSVDDTAATHALTYVGVAVTFPKTGGLFPFELAGFNNGGRTAFELAWADGDQTAAPPSYDSNTGAWTNPGFTLVPASALYAADVRAPLIATTPGGVAVAANGTVDFTATVKNVGAAPAYPLDGGTSGLTYTLALPSAIFPIAKVGRVQVNGADAGFTATTTGPTTFVSADVASPGASGKLLPGLANAATVAVRATLANGSSGHFDVQGVVKGHATDPAVFAGQAVVPPVSLHVYTDDPSANGATDTGNAPPMSGDSDEVGGTGAITFISGAVAGDDDDSLGLDVGKAPVSAPTITPFAGDLVSTLAATTVHGAVTGGNTPSLRVTLSTVVQAACMSFGGSGAGPWTWDATAGICTCLTNAAGGAWACDPIALADCAAAGNCYTAVASVGDANDVIPGSASYSFRAAGAAVTISTPAPAATVNKHDVTVSGSASVGGSAVPNGTMVTATVTGGAAPVSCTGSITAGAWSCAVALVADGAYSASAAAIEANGGTGPASASVAFTVDTHPAITAIDGSIGEATTNDTRPTFSGTRIGDGPKIRICKSAVPACSAGNVCTTGAISAGTTAWSCRPGGAIAAGTYVAVELDATTGLSGPSNSVVVNATAAALTNVSNGQVFNLASPNPFTLAGTCVAGESVTAAFQDNSSAAWPASGPLTCTATCASGWSCPVTFPANTEGTSLKIVVTENTPDNVKALVSSVTGIVVDTKPPAAATVTVAPSPVLVAGPNPPAIGGAGETAATITLSLTGTASNGDAITATCTAPGASPTVASGAWSCTAWDVVDTVSSAHTTAFPDGTYTVTASETDQHGNPQTAPAASMMFRVKQQKPPAPALSLPAFVGIAGNPPTASGTGEVGDVVTVTAKSGATVLGTCTSSAVAANGSWSCSSWTNTFTDSGSSSYTATATQNDTFNDSPASATSTFKVDLVRPLTPTITGPAAGSFTPLATLAVTAAEPNGLVTIVVKKGSTTVATCPPIVVPASGSLAVSCNPTLATGAYTMLATQTDAAGNTTAVAASRAFNVDVDTPLAPTLNAPASPGPSPALLTGTAYPASTVTVKDGGGNTICTSATAGSTPPGPYAWSCAPAPALDDLDFTLTAFGGAPNGLGSSSPVTLSVRSLPAPTLAGPAVTSDTKPALTLTAPAGVAGQVATVYDGAAPVCTMTLPALTCSGLLAIGDHSLTAALADGHTPVPHRSLPSAAIAVSVIPTTPQLEAGTPFGSSQPLLAGGGASPGSEVTIAATADGRVLCVATAGADGSFSCQVGASPAGVTLADGTLATSLVARFNGKASAAGHATLILRATPSLAQPQSPTRNASPQLCAALQPGAPVGTKVTITEAGQALCSATSTAAAGPICCTPAEPLSDGAHRLSCFATFPPGGQSAPAPELELRIKTSTQAPTFSSPGSGATVPADVTLAGTAEAGATVSIAIDGGAPATATADAGGSWSLPLGPVTSGAHSALAQATDSLGNQSATAALHFTVGLGGAIRGSSAFGCSTTSSSAGWLALCCFALLLPRARRKRAGGAMLALAAAAAAASGAQAQSLNLDRFRPAADGDGLFALEGARPPAEGDGALQLRLWVDGSSRPLVFKPDVGSERALIRNRVGAWLSAQVHAAGPLSFAVQLPFLLGQHGDLSGLPADVTGGGTLGTGLGDLRLLARVGLLRQGAGPIDLAVQAAVELPTGSKTGFVGDGQAQGEALAAAGHRFDLGGPAGVDLLANAFVRLKQAREVLGIKEGSELGLRGGVAWLPGSDAPFAPARVMLELEEASFLRAGFAGGAVGAEWHAGVTYCLGSVLALDLGAGGGLAGGIGTPGLRMLGAVSFGHSACGQGVNTSVRVRPPPRLAEVTAPPASPPPPAPARVKAEGPAAQPPPPPVAIAVAEPPPPLPALPELPAIPPDAPSKQERVVAAVPALPELPPLPAAPRERKLASISPPPELAPPPALEAPPLQAQLAGNHIVLARPLGFRGDSSRLTADGKSLLDDVAKLLAAHPEIGELRVLGHADTDDHAHLAHVRALAVAAYLRAHGVEPSRLSAQGVGTSQPLMPSISRSARKKNQRIELTVLMR